MHQTCDPKHARAWFAFRKPLAWIASGGTVALLIFILAPFIPFIFALLISIIAAACLFFLYLDDWTIGFKCPKCGGYIEPNVTPWICPNKDTPHRNDQVDEYPFINECQQCHSKPKTYQCHHCRESIFLTKDRQTTAYARCADVQVAMKARPRVKRDRHAEELAKVQKTIDLNTKKVREAELEIELRGLKLNLEPPKSVRERLRGKVGSRGELDAEVRQMKAEANAEFKDDPDECERWHRLIDDEARDLLE